MKAKVLLGEKVSRWPQRIKLTLSPDHAVGWFCA